MADNITDSEPILINVVEIGDIQGYTRSPSGGTQNPDAMIRFTYLLYNIGGVTGVIWTKILKNGVSIFNYEISTAPGMYTSIGQMNKLGFETAEYRIQAGHYDAIGGPVMDDEIVDVIYASQGEANVSTPTWSPLSPLPGDIVTISWQLVNIGAHDYLWQQIYLDGVLAHEELMIELGQSAMYASQYQFPIYNTTKFYIVAGHYDPANNPVTDITTIEYEIAIVGDVAEIGELTYPSEVEADTPFDIDYWVNNLAGDNVFWGGIYDNDVLIPGSYWTRNVTFGDIFEIVFTHPGISQNASWELRVGYVI